MGHSGSGKSTVAKLIAGFWDVNEGELMIGGRNVRDIPLEAQTERIAYVEQNNFLFDETVMENIRKGKAVMRLLNSRVFKVNGSVKWNGQEILGKKAKLPKGYRGQQVAMITQNPMTAFAPMIKLGKQIEMGFELKGRKAKKEFYEQLDSALKSVNLGDLNKILVSYPDELSGDMLQRVMIAITL